jgi:hypothetical protein
MVLATIEPYIKELEHNMSSDQLIQCYFGFSHPHCASRLDILDSLESRLIKLAPTFTKGRKHALLK